MHGLRKSKKWVMFLGENRLHKNQAGRKLSMHLSDKVQGVQYGYIIEELWD